MDELRDKALGNFFKLDLAPARPQNRIPVSTCMGRIDRLLLTIPAYALEGLDAAYRSILTQLPPYTRLVIGTHESALETVENWLASAGIADRSELFTIGDHLHFSVWAEDGYAVAIDTASGKTYFIEPFSFPRYGDGLIADFASGATDLETPSVPSIFRGAMSSSVTASS